MMTLCNNYCSCQIAVALMNMLLVQCSPMPTIQDIVSSVTQISEEGETDDVGDPLPLVTYKQAFPDLRSYLLCSQGRDSENLYTLLRVSFSKLAVILLCKARLQII